MPIDWEERFETVEKERLLQLSSEDFRRAYENGIITREEYEAAISNVEGVDEEKICLTMEAMAKMGVLRKVKCPVVYDGKGNAVVFGSKQIEVYGIRDPRRLVEEEVEDRELKERLIERLVIEGWVREV